MRPHLPVRFKTDTESPVLGRFACGDSPLVSMGFASKAARQQCVPGRKTIGYNGMGSAILHCAGAGLSCIQGSRNCPAIASNCKQGGWSFSNVLLGSVQNGATQPGGGLWCRLMVRPRPLPSPVLQARWSAHPLPGPPSLPSSQSHPCASRMLTV